MRKTKQIENKKRAWRSILKAILIILIIMTVVISVVGLVFAIYVEKNIEKSIDETLFGSVGSDGVTKLYYYDFEDRENRVGEAHELVEQEIYGGYNCMYTELGEIPDNLKNAFVSIEDKRFYSHSGVDFKRTASAALNYFLKFDSSYGGSTITQQLIKNVTQKDEYSFKRKIQEIFWALDLETKMSKDEILELYLNIINLSEGCYGVGAASSFYFSKDVSELTLNECACIAAITNSPSYYDPLLNPDNNTYRRKLILNEMYSQGYITHDELNAALNEEIALNIANEERKTTSVNSWYTDMVIEDVINDLMKEKGYSRQIANLMIYTGGLKIYTAIDPDVQNTVEEYYSKTSNFYGAMEGEKPQSSLIVIDRRTGDILGVAGAVGEKSANRIQNYATQTLRPAGSAIKPLSVYAPALDKGIITWSSVYDDVPVSFGSYNIEGGIKPIPWPSNSNGNYRGLSNVNYAIEHSLNTVVVRALDDLGIDNSFDFLYNDLEMKSLIAAGRLSNGTPITDKDIAALALGQFNYGVTVRELTAAYSALANEGVYNKPRSYICVKDSKGNDILKNEYEGKSVITRESADIMTKMLQNVVKSGTASSVTLDEYIDCAGKTGTTQNNFDKWFIGYTPEYICGVWFGYDYPKEIKDTVANRSVKIWNDVMTKLHSEYISSEGKSKLRFEASADLVEAEYCMDSGKRLTEACLKDARGSRAEKGYFVRGTEPTKLCDCHVLVAYDAEGAGVADADCDPSGVTYVGMISVKRSFPMQIYVTDAEYVWRDIGKDVVPNTSETQPFFANILSEGEFCGISKARHQYNRYCRKHFNYYSWKERQ